MGSHISADPDAAVYSSALALGANCHRSESIPRAPSGRPRVAYKGAENTTTFAASNTIVVSLPTQ